MRRFFSTHIGNKFVQWTLAVFRDFFVVILTTYLILTMVENIWSNSISDFLNMGYLLIVVIVSGVISVFSQPKHSTDIESKRLSKKDIAFIVCPGIGGAAIIWYTTNEVGWLSYLISITGGAMIILLSLLVINGESTKTGNQAEDGTIIEATNISSQRAKEAEEACKKASDRDDT